MIDEIKLAQGPAKPATPAEEAQDLTTGVTKPNLHRRIDDDLQVTISTDNTESFYLTTEDGFRLTTEDGDRLVGEETEVLIGEGKYTVLVSGVNSFRGAQCDLHDEDSTTSEVP